MTAHRAPSPVTMEVNGVSRENLCGANAPGRPREADGPFPAVPPLTGGTGYLPRQPSATWALEPRPESVKAGRDFTRAMLAGWGMTALTEVAELVVSELVTNALRHGLPSASTFVPGQCVRLRLLAQAPFVMCMVSDPGSGIPVLRESGPTAECGRGLHVVESCSERWGWHLLDQGGKVVWALLRG